MNLNAGVLLWGGGGLSSSSLISLFFYMYPLGYCYLLMLALWLETQTTLPLGDLTSQTSFTGGNESGRLGNGYTCLADKGGDLIQGPLFSVAHILNREGGGRAGECGSRTIGASRSDTCRVTLTTAAAAAHLSAAAGELPEHTGKKQNDFQALCVSLCDVFIFLLFLMR